VQLLASGQTRHMSAATRPASKLPLAAWGLTGSDSSNDGGGSAFKRILLSVSGSKQCSHAVDLVVALASDRGSRVFVIHFYERLLLGRGAYIDLESLEDADRLVNRVCAELEERGVNAEAWTERSYPHVTGRLIALAAKACRADLIVIGCSRGKSPLWSVLRGAVLHEVVHRSGVPVLVVP
jgi:nucleotide-binding universal stress UspA family protein